MQHKPLENIRILELGGYISAPYASSLLCALGADVVKVESADGDAYRFQQNDRSPFFRQYNAGKRSIGVNLKNPDGLELMNALVPRFDVVLENMRPGKATALGLGPEQCAELAPHLVYASITGFGNGGPLEQRPAYDTIGQAVGGLYSVLGDAGSPQLSGTCIADLITGLTTATGILAGLVGRTATGTGQRVETSIMEAVSTLTIEAMTQYFDKDHQNPTRESRHPQAQNFCLKTSTGEDIAIHLSSSEKFWLCLLGAMERNDLADDPRFTTYRLRVEHYFELAEIIEAEFLRKPAHYWEERLSEADVPFSPVLTMGDFVEHPQVKWLELVEPEKDGLSLLRPPWKFGGERPERPSFAPKLGQHTREVAGEVYDESRIGELFANGVLFEEL